MCAYYSRAELFQMAVELESGAEQFYLSTAKMFMGRPLQRPFETIARQERTHAKMYERLLAKSQEEGLEMPSGDTALYVRAVLDSDILKGLRQKHRSIGSELDAIRFAVGMEKETVLFYYGLRDFAAATELEVLDSIIRQERKHLIQVSELLNDLVRTTNKTSRR